MFARLRARANPYWLYVASQSGMSLLVAVSYTTAIVYWVKSGHLNPLQLILLGTTVELSYFVLQLPTGVVADIISRRLCVIAGMFLTAGGFLMQGLSPAFAMMLSAQVLVGFGAALMFGAEEAWLADELGDADLTATFLRSSQFGLVGTIVGSVLSGVIARDGLNMPFIVGGGLIAVEGIVLAGVMPERNFRPPDRTPRLGGTIRGTWRMLTLQTTSARQAMRTVPGLVLLLAMIFFMGLWSESFDRLWGDYFLRDIKFPHVAGLDTATWFSAIAVAVSLLSLGSTELARRRTARLGPSSAVSTLLGFTGLLAVAVLAMIVLRSFVPVVIAYLAVATLRPVLVPLRTGWIISQVPSGVRVTALSAVDMFDSGGQIIGGPIIGVVGVLAPIRIALLAGAGALAPACGLLVAATRRLRSSQTGRPPSGGD